MDDLESALAAIAAHGKEAGFVGRRSEIVVRSAEKALGLRFPPTYRRFLLELGAGSFGSSEIYGVVDIDFENSCVPDAVWATVQARERDDLPVDLIAIGQDDDELTCLQIRPKAEEGPVIALNAGEDPERVGTRAVANDFGAYLLSRVREELEAAE
jgi:hypothetical protein